MDLIFTNALWSDSPSCPVLSLAMLSKARDYYSEIRVLDRSVSLDSGVEHLLRRIHGCENHDAISHLALGVAKWLRMGKEPAVLVMHSTAECNKLRRQLQAVLPALISDEVILDIRPVHELAMKLDLARSEVLRRWSPSRHAPIQHPILESMALGLSESGKLPVGPNRSNYNLLLGTRRYQTLQVEIRRQDEKTSAASPNQGLNGLLIV